MTRILFVEDDASLGYALEFSLIDEGYEIVRVCTIHDAKEQFIQDKFDLILLDVNLPDGNGYDFCKYVREKSNIPIIFLTALDDEVNVVLGLEIGANDYLTKPFGVRELLARIKVQLRSNLLDVPKDKLVSGDIAINTSTTQVYKKEEVLNLTALEYKLLILFIHNPQKTLKRDYILGSITGEEDTFFDENTLSVYIKRLREKVEDDPKNPKYIITQRGLGYTWNVKVGAI
ncbi:response regulator transcription factor [Clostridium frigidicarnis]|uniref:Stage 0 sporulation protein A homolog n=1 Tax=Clostridium frigidicarnis TaxID=84698 RepID=A0A1I0X5T2_9CLOT|nr:response regulator transcription factor [Clostridium frigidicarnis]SFA95708.1 DNA-binding response regulator, OmpR family, contains REC and winged-helix (wHTH) domain [Clostridium frigidicarnis]